MVFGSLWFPGSVLGSVWLPEALRSVGSAVVWFGLRRFAVSILEASEQDVACQDARSRLPEMASQGQEHLTCPSLS